MSEHTEHFLSSANSLRHKISVIRQRIFRVPFLKQYLLQNCQSQEKILSLPINSNISKTKIFLTKPRMLKSKQPSDL